MTNREYEIILSPDLHITPPTLPPPGMFMIANRQLELKQYEQAMASYQKVLEQVGRLESMNEERKNALKANIYHNLGVVAQEQRKWEEAEEYYQQALQIKVEYQDRYAQASTYHNLGMVAQEQGKWEEAEGYYQQALQIYVEYNDRYEQAGTYGQLGLLAQQQQQWVQARDYLLQALEIFTSYNDDYSAGITLRNLARLWRESGDASLPGMVAEKLGVSVEETEKLLREALGNGDSGTQGEKKDQDEQ